MKKIIAGVLALAATTGFAFAELSFSNKLATDIVNIVHLDGAGEEDKTTFAGITNKMSAEYDSEKVDLFVEAKIGLFSADDAFNGQPADDDAGYYIDYDDFDWFIHFRPFDIVELALHEGYSFDGSYFPVWDDNVPNAGLGSDGFSVVVSPIEGLSLGVTLPFGSYFGGRPNFFSGKSGTYDNTFNIGFGASYAYEDLFSIGANVYDVIDGDGDDGDARQLGAYISFTGVENLVLNAGFTYAAENSGVELAPDYFGFGEMQAEKLISAAATYDVGALSLSADFAYSLDDETGAYDLYAGAGIGYQLNDQLSLGVSGLVLTDLSDDGKDLVFGVNPSITYSLNEHHEFGAGAQIEFCGDNHAFNFPIYWKYSL